MSLVDKIKKMYDARVQALPWFALANGFGNVLGELSNPDKNNSVNEIFGQGCLNYLKIAPFTIYAYFKVLDKLEELDYSESQKKRHAVLTSLTTSLAMTTYHTYAGTYHPIGAMFIPTMVQLIITMNYRPKN